MTNAIAISRNLAAAGLEKQVADAIAEAVVTHSDENAATKVDLAETKAGLTETKADIARLEKNSVPKADFVHLQGNIATKEDLAEVRAKLETDIAGVKAENKMIITLNIGMFIGIIVLILDRFLNS